MNFPLEGNLYWESLYYIISINIDVNDNITYLLNSNSNPKKKPYLFFILLTSYVL
jgi:hypothetical protein